MDIFWYILSLLIIHMVVFREEEYEREEQEETVN